MSKRLEISLAPSGRLTLHLPSERTLEIQNSEGGMLALTKILRDYNTGESAEDKGYIREFPTQHVLNKWLREDSIRKAQAAKERAEAAAQEMGVNLDELDISL